MSTQYKVVVHCDEVASHRCYGFVEFSTPTLDRLATHTEIAEKGWLRGYSGEQTYDVCPACRPGVERQMAEQDDLPTRPLAAEER